MRILHDFICGALLRLDAHTYWINIATDTIAILIVLAVTVLAHYIMKILMLKLVKHSKYRSKSFLISIVSDRKIRKLLIHLFSATLFCGLIKTIIKYDVSISLPEIIVYKISLFYAFILVLITLSYAISSINNIYEKRFDFASQYPIYSYLKVVILFIWLVGIILIISFFLQTSPWVFLTGVGAVSAVFLLVFKDTLLGIVASIQVTASNIVRIGDRISIDEFGIDGVVLDIAINTVKVKNGDHTIANIPTYALASKVVKNWRGMEESGGRRIKRSILIDINSVKICSDELINHLRQKAVLAKYMDENKEQLVNNLTLFRIYLTDYLANCKHINQKYIVLVHQLDQVAAGGLPLEVCAFTHDVSFAGHENIKSEMFEHFFALLPLFELKVYQA